MKKLKGFTLVELVITIAIVIILSVVSVPIYRGYVDKAQMSEGYALLGTILSAQKSYYGEYGNFLQDIHGSAKGNCWTVNDEVLGIDARGNKYYTYFCIDTDSTFQNKYYFNAVTKNINNGYLTLRYNNTTGANFYLNNY